MIEVKLSSGRVCLLDDDQKWILDKFKLYSCKDHVKAEYYVDTEYGVAKLTVYLHRLVMGLTKTNGSVIDHKNRNGHDNRKENLRYSTPKQNAQNKFYKNGKSKYKGVVHRSNHKSKPFGCFITHSEKSNNVGYFKEEKSAATLYDINAILKHQEFAYLNFPENKKAYLQVIEDLNLKKSYVVCRTRKGYVIKSSETSYKVRDLETVNNAFLDMLS